MCVITSFIISLRFQRPIPVAAPFKAWDWDRSLDGIAGSNPAGSMDVCLLWVLRVVGWGLWVGVITRPEDSYRLWCVWVWSRRPVRGVHDPESGWGAPTRCEHFNVCLWLLIWKKYNLKVAPNQKDVTSYFLLRLGKYHNFSLCGQRTPWSATVLAFCGFCCQTTPLMWRHHNK
jgi:hypothetical protein